MHIIHKILPTYEYDYTNNFDTHFRPLPEVVTYDPNSVDPQYGLDPYWDEEIYVKTNWSTKIITINIMIRSNLMI